MPYTAIPAGSPPPLVNGLSGGQSNNQPADPRGTPFMQPLFQGPQNAAVAGERFVVTNATPGTGDQYALTTAFNDTTGAFIVFKNNDVAAGRSVILDYCKLLLTGTAPATTTVMHLAIKVDSASRAPTAGAPRAATPVNPNGGSSALSIISPFNIATGGAGITVPASSVNVRLVARGEIATSLGITGDEYMFLFGHQVDAGGHGGGTAVRATAAARMVSNMGPVIVGPQQWCVVYLWWLTATTTAPTFEYEIGWVEA